MKSAETTTPADEPGVSPDWKKWTQAQKNVLICPSMFDDFLMKNRGKKEKINVCHKNLQKNNPWGSLFSRKSIWA